MIEMMEDVDDTSETGFKFNETSSYPSEEDVEMQAPDGEGPPSARVKPCCVIGSKHDVQDSSLVSKIVIDEQGTRQLYERAQLAPPDFKDGSLACFHGLLGDQEELMCFLESYLSVPRAAFDNLDPGLYAFRMAKAQDGWRALFTDEGGGESVLLIYWPHENAYTAPSESHPACTYWSGHATILMNSEECEQLKKENAGH
uniref:Uncharacterized protein n=1 Tax=Chromera velia CCMP2878 TaxID=1169474 RepID=A0A0G4G983_9ALVE|eukprot:Cvel_4358.t1-p1 / transcript=Cvel_4358.t1 / gene=Cvel_4358 / organism=Chromera_velia_CCMP2878 / gene_product=hypothetical protein / transcript_product=hypothetical protein / location=Cvel_scaffold189:17187-18180(+) / protein_length=199 / sequence_SO=supercontig / SO=protein_coding / is_pseudo=false